MSDYRRTYVPGSTYFFTIVTYARQAILTREENVERLRQAFRVVMAKRPFAIEAIVVLPDHLHCVWRLPPTDLGFSARWRLIKRYFSTGIEGSRTRRRERDIWQRRFWEHLIRDEEDWRRHVDYIHYNPVKHGYVASPADWPYSSFRWAVARGWYEPGWGRSEPAALAGMDFE